MFGYVTLGTNNLDRAIAFYDALLAEIGAQRFARTATMAAWRRGHEAPSLMVTTPFDGGPASVGNGTMLAIPMKDANSVDAFYCRAIELGATNEGEPGPRGTGFYAGYFRDPDGNKLNAFWSA